MFIVLNSDQYKTCPGGGWMGGGKVKLKGVVANKSRPAVNTRMAGDSLAQVTDSYVEPVSGPSNQSSSQGELSVGKVVGHVRIASQVMKGVEANKSRSAIRTRVGEGWSMVAARRLMFEPENKLPEESVGEDGCAVHRGRVKDDGEQDGVQG